MLLAPPLIFQPFDFYLFILCFFMVVLGSDSAKFYWHSGLAIFNIYDARKLSFKSSLSKYLFDNSWKIVSFYFNKWRVTSEMRNFLAFDLDLNSVVAHTMVNIHLLLVVYLISISVDFSRPINFVPCHLLCRLSHDRPPARIWRIGP